MSPALEPEHESVDDFPVGVHPWESGDMSLSARMIAELNIQHYRRLLKTETDEVTRRTIAKLLAEEEAKLGDLPPETEQDRREPQV